MPYSARGDHPWYEDGHSRKELPVNDKCSCCLALSDRIMELEDIVHPESDAFGLIRDRFKLTVREASVLMVLLRFKRSISKDEMLTLAYPIEHDRPELKIVDVFICKLRKKLPPEFCPKTDWGMGYYLDSTARRGLQAIAGIGGGRSDDDAGGETIIDFSKIRAAAFGAIAAASPGKPTVNIKAVEDRLRVIAPAIKAATIDAGWLREVQRTATDIVAR